MHVGQRGLGTYQGTVQAVALTDLANLELTTQNAWVMVEDVCKRATPQSPYALPGAVRSA